MRTLVVSQVHARIHAAATLGVVVLCFLLRPSSSDLAALALSVGLVWSAEAMNTAVEFVVDLASPEYHELAKKAKDVAAAGVLLAAIASAVAGLLILYPLAVARLVAP